MSIWLEVYKNIKNLKDSQLSSNARFYKEQIVLYPKAKEMYFCSQNMKVVALYIFYRELEKEAEWKHVKWHQEDNSLALKESWEQN